MGHIHVKDKSTGHEYVIPERLFNPDAHEATGKPTRDRHGDIAPFKPRTAISDTPKAKQARRNRSQRPVEPAEPTIPSVETEADDSGQQAETEEE